NHAQGFAQDMSAKSPQSNKNETADGGKNQHKTAGHASTLRKLLFVTKAEFLLFTRRFFQNPLAESRYFTEFCLAVMTNQIKCVLTDQNIVKWANKSPGLNLRLRH